MHGKRMISIDRHDYSLRCVACVCVVMLSASFLSFFFDRYASLSLSISVLSWYLLLDVCRTLPLTQHTRKPKKEFFKVEHEKENPIGFVLPSRRKFFVFKEEKKILFIRVMCVCVKRNETLIVSSSWMLLLLLLLIRSAANALRLSLCIFLLPSPFKYSVLSFFFFCIFFPLFPFFFGFSFPVRYLFGRLNAKNNRQRLRQWDHSISNATKNKISISICFTFAHSVNWRWVFLSLSVYVCVMHRINNRRVVQKGCAHPPYHHHGQTSECIEAQHLSLFTHCSFPLQHCPCV